MNTEFIRKLIGRPWVSGGSGPDEFDCWGLVRWVYQESFGIDLNGHEERDALSILDNVLLGKREISSGDWALVDGPRDGDAVALSKGGSFHHIGIYVFQNRSILHCMPGYGVTLQTFASMKSNGFLRFKFYQHERRRIC